MGWRPGCSQVILLVALMVLSSLCMPHPKSILAVVAGTLLLPVSIAFAGETQPTSTANPACAPMTTGENDDAVVRAIAASRPTLHPTSQPTNDESLAGCAVTDDGSFRPGMEPDVFFRQLVDRYKGLHLYRDTSRVVQVTSREGAETSRVETEFGCEVIEGALKVMTAGAQARSAAGLDLPVKKSPAAEAMQRGYDLWLAPHMSLKFADEPLKDFRNGVEEGFTATEAEAVTIDDRQMLHVELRSGDGLSENPTAKFDLFINPETMLVERIDGEQRMPDGANCTTTMQITPRDFEDEPAHQ